MPESTTSFLALAGFLVLAWSAAIPGGRYRPGPWYYEALDRPPWTPPSWLFAPAWSTLFTAMGVAAWLVWLEGGWSGAAGTALSLFVVHLPVNAAWSWLFFGKKRPDWAGIELVALWLFILVLVVLFWQLRPLAGVLLVPYLAWVTFAGVLNASIWRRNAGRIAELARAHADE